MARCSDCLYFERCVSLGVELNIEKNREADKNCLRFKDATDVVEVVRCRDCVYYSRFPCKNQDGYDGHCHGTNHGTCDSGYCSFGRRKVRIMRGDIEDGKGKIE